MAQLNIFDLPELLEQILHFLAIDRSLCLLIGYGTCVLYR